MTLSMKTKFLIPTIAAAVICLSAMSLTAYLKSKTALETSITNQVEYVSNAVSRQLGTWIMERKKDLGNFSREGLMVSAAEAGAGNEAVIKDAISRLQDIKSGSPFYEFVALTDARGMVVASSESAHVGTMNLGDRDYFKAARGGEIALSQVIRSKASGNPVFCISAPVYHGGAVNGVLVGVVELAYFTSAFVDSEKVGETGYAYIINNQGLMLAYPDKAKILNLDLSQYDFGREMLTKKNGVIEYTFKDIDKIVAFAQEKNMGWIVASTANKSEIFAPVAQIRNLSLILGSACVVLIAGILFFITQSIVSPINRIITGMQDGAVQVAAASGQISSSSQSLAQGASQQAAAIEETSSLMEEMSAMTRSNADNAGQANSLMKETTRIVGTASESMSALSMSMKDISKASKETSKIIKTIDEIAFQTNLLALNAAVEAARAGEAGAGFAVVADEVRNLAMRAAEAAKNTSNLIESTVQEIGKGSEIMEKTNAAFVEVSTQTRKVGALVAEIAEASSEQSKGIAHVNNAVSEMDSVVQLNAANAEESASAAEEMNAQADQLNTYVSSLVQLVTGKEENTQMLLAPAERRTPLRQLQGRPRQVQARPLPQKVREVAPDQLISMDDDGFKDF